MARSTRHTPATAPGRHASAPPAPDQISFLETTPPLSDNDLIGYSGPLPSAETAHNERRSSKKAPPPRRRSPPPGSSATARSLWRNFPAANQNPGPPNNHDS